MRIEKLPGSRGNLIVDCRDPDHKTGRLGLYLGIGHAGHRQQTRHKTRNNHLGVVAAHMS